MKKNASYASHLLSIQRGGGFAIYPEHIRNLLIPIAQPSDMKALSDYAKQELSLHAKLKRCSTPQDKQVIENAIKTLDDQVNTLVYNLWTFQRRDRWAIGYQTRKA